MNSLNKKNKQCKSCLKTRLIKFFNMDFSRGYVNHRGKCKVCESEYKKQWAIKIKLNPKKHNDFKKRKREYAKGDVHKKHRLKWNENNKDKILLKNNRYRENNKEKILKKQRNKDKIDREKINDNYIIHTFTNRKGNTLTHSQLKKIPELLEAKRTLIKLKRLIYKK